MQHKQQRANRQRPVPRRQNTVFVQPFEREVDAFFAASTGRERTFTMPKEKLPRIGEQEVVRELNRVRSARDNGNDVICDFSGKQIEGVDFTTIEALVEEKNLLRAAKFNDAHLLHCRFGPKALPERTSNQAIPLEDWTQTPSINLKKAEFNGAHIYSCNFSGANISFAEFQGAHLFLSYFDLVDTADGNSWDLTSFDGARIENCYFRGARLRASFAGADIFKTDFTPADLPVFEKQSVDERLRRLSGPCELKISAPKGVFVEEIEWKRKEISRLNNTDDAAWRNVFNIIEQLVGDDALKIPLRNLVRTKLNESVFDGAFIYSCAFRAARMDHRVLFDHSIVLKSDFRSARIEELAWDHTIYVSLLSEIEKRLSADDHKVVEWSLRRFVFQLARRVEEQAEVIAHEPEFNNPKGRVVSRMAGASFDFVTAKDVHFNAASASNIQLAKALISDCTFDETDMVCATLDDAVFKRTTFDDADIDDATAMATRFDGELLGGRSIAIIERMSEDYRRRLDDVERGAIGKNDKRREEKTNDATAVAPGDKEDDGGDYGPDAMQADENSDRQSQNRVNDASFKKYHQQNTTLKEALSFACAFFKELQDGADNDAVGAQSGMHVAEQGASESCSFQAAHLRRLKASEASFQACFLENANFEEGEFGRTVGRGAANFDYSFMRGANFANATLDNVSFSGATLTGMQGLDKAVSLQGANFFDSRGLDGREFAGANLTGVSMPSELRSFGGVLTSVMDLTRQARILFATLMFVCAFSVLTMVNISADENDDSDGVLNAINVQENDGAVRSQDRTTEKNDDGSVNAVMPTAGMMQGAGPSTSLSSGFKLPVIGVQVSRSNFYLITPFLIVAFFLMFHLKFSRIWLESKSLPYRFPDNRLIDRHVFPWVFASLLTLSLKPSHNLRGANVERETKSILEQAISILEKWLAYFLGWVVVPLTILFMLFEQIRLKNGVYRDVEIPALNAAGFDVVSTTAIALCVAFLITIFSSLPIFVKGVREVASTEERAMRRRNKENDDQVSGDRRGRISRFLERVRARLVDWYEQLVYAVQTAWRRMKRIFTGAAIVGVAASICFSLINIPGLLNVSAHSVRDEAVASAVLELADAIGFSFYALSPATLHAKAPNADFARREIAFLTASNAAFMDVDFSYSVFTRPRFDNANLQGARFDGARFVFADFSNADLTGANFRNTQLLSADFSGAVGAESAAFDGACANALTVLPDGITSLPDCPKGVRHHLGPS